MALALQAQEEGELNYIEQDEGSNLDEDEDEEYKPKKRKVASRNNSTKGK